MEDLNTDNPFEAIVADEENKIHNNIPILPDAEDENTGVPYKENIISKKVKQPYKAKGVFYTKYSPNEAYPNTQVITFPETILLDINRMLREIDEVNKIRLNSNRKANETELLLKITLMKSRPKPAYEYVKICNNEQCKKEFITHQQADIYCPECKEVRRLAKIKPTEITKECKKCKKLFTVPIKLRMSKYCLDCSPFKKDTKYLNTSVPIDIQGEDKNDIQ